MRQYRVLARSYIGGLICNAGEVVDHDPADGHVSWNLEPLDPEERIEWERLRADPEQVADAEEKARGYYPQPGGGKPYSNVGSSHAIGENS